MKKIEELADPTSCWSKARPDERLFVLLARDRAAPATIRFWAEERIRLGKNHVGDAQMVEAIICAELMEREQREP